MENLPPSAMIMLGIVVAALFAFIGLHFSSIANHIQNVVKLRSDWIDCFRKEISCFSSQVTIISVLWKMDLLVNQVNKLSDEEFKKFRNDNKEGYQILLESYSSIVLRLDSRKTSHASLRGLLDKTIDKFTGNDKECGVNSIESLRKVTEKAEEVIEYERDEIEVNTPKQQKQEFILHSLIVLSVVVLASIITFSTIPDNMQPSEKKEPKAKLEMEIQSLRNDLDHFSEIILPLKKSNSTIISDIRESKLIILNEIQKQSCIVDEHLDRHLKLLSERIRISKQHLPNN